MKRRSVVAGLLGTVAAPLLAGCSDPGTVITLEPRDVRAVATDDGGTWEVTFDVAYRLEGLDEGDGLYGVVAHLVDGRGNERAKRDLGDLAWTDLAPSERETGEYDDGIEYYRGTYRERVTLTATRQPRWVVFTVDSAVGSGVGLSASIYGVRRERQSTAGEGSDPAGEGSDPERNESKRNESTGAVDLSLAVWERVRLDRYETFPPSTEMPAPGPSNGTRNGPNRSSEEPG